MNRAAKNFLSLVTTLFGVVSSAQVGGKITGVVKDQTSSARADAAVVVTQTQTGVKLSAATDQEGVFTLPVLSVGQYEIGVTADAFKPYRKTGLATGTGSGKNDGKPG